MPAEEKIETSKMIDDATVAMAMASEKYEGAVKAMKALEGKRAELVGGASWDTTRMKGVAQKLLPLVMKYGSVMAGGGGLAALVSDPGAFKGLLTSLTGVLGGG